jgi:hypothetical protein
LFPKEGKAAEGGAEKELSVPRRRKEFGPVNNDQRLSVQ